MIFFIEAKFLLLLNDAGSCFLNYVCLGQRPLAMNFLVSFMICSFLLCFEVKSLEKLESLLSFVVEIES